MAVLGFLNTSNKTPAEIVVDELTRTDDFSFDKDKLSTAHVVLTSIDNPEDCDKAWTWRLTDDAPRISDDGVTTVFADATDSTHPGVDSGVIAEFEDYMGHVVIFDTDGESVDALLEYAVGQLEHPSADVMMGSDA